VLRGIAAKLRENIRDGVDIAARYGGEEFALILVKTDGPNAVETCSRIRQNIADAVHSATHDGLTGLLNHREFQVVLKDEITRAIRYNDPLSLVICDIDFFKKVNDTYGHPFGDTVLKTVAALLEGSIRQGIDTAARYGGEEFALILVKTDEAQAIETAERIRETIARTLLKSPSGSDVHLTMSFGIAIFGKHAGELGELIKKADKALYRAKKQGRNRVEVF
jgi:diguanylate cyclase (GGDEF)-like protein